MNTENIKFRALCTADGIDRMVYFGVSECDNGLFAWPMPMDVDHIDEYLSPLMQFTGLKDKNGNEIYEGDVLRNINDHGLFNWLVEFKDGCFVIVNIGIEGLLGERYKVDSTMFTDREIIGNKYSNPELFHL